MPKLRHIALLGAALAALAPAALAVGGWRIFGTVEFRSDSLKALPRWERALIKINDERPQYAACDQHEKNCTSRGMVAWRAMLKSAKGRPPEEQLRIVNRFTNAWDYRTDDTVWMKDDFWASPSEFLKFSGDCEDYSILKLVSLRELGFADDDVRIVIVRDVLRNIPHAVLAVKMADKIFIMDSLFDAVLPQESVMQYAPQYSINETSRWVHVAPLGLAASKPFAIDKNGGGQ
jgi:predicted transglutaminase-like cysteine proteinase